MHYAFCCFLGTNPTLRRISVERGADCLDHSTVKVKCLDQWDCTAVLLCVIVDIGVLFTWSDQSVMYSTYSIYCHQLQRQQIECLL